MEKKNRTWLIVSALLAIAAAAGVFYYAYTTYDRLVATTEVIVTAEEIEPYTVITADHLQVKEMPRAILNEDVYVAARELVGRISISHIPAGALIYRPLAVPQARFRYVSDPELEVISIPVDPARAVGGQIKIGHVVNVYRAARSTRRPEASDPAAVLSREGAAVELLTSAPVVDVRSNRGDTVRGQAASSQTEREAQTSSPVLEIVTLAVAPDSAEDLVRLAVEQESDYELWLSLAPASASISAAAVSAADAAVSVSARRTPQGVRLSWSGAGDGALSHYVIYCWDEEAGAWQPVASIPLEEDGEYEYAVSCPGSSRYGVAAVAPDGGHGVIAVASTRSSSR